jgi:hypothetical protein
MKLIPGNLPTLFKFSSPVAVGLHPTVGFHSRLPCPNIYPFFLLWITRGRSLQARTPKAQKQMSVQTND